MRTAQTLRSKHPNFVKEDDLPHVTLRLPGQFPTACDTDYCPYPSHASSQGQSREAQEDCPSLRLLQALQTKGTVSDLFAPIVTPPSITPPNTLRACSSRMEGVESECRAAEESSLTSRFLTMSEPSLKMSGVETTAVSPPPRTHLIGFI
jgi:hypothetical protein